MAVNIYREYRLKFYLNARHYIILDGKQGETHPHTWELSLTIRVGRGSFTQFRTFEQRINEYLAAYQNRVMNECAPFDAIVPTLENITDYFAGAFYDQLAAVGGELTRVEASETPAHSYILDLEQLRRPQSEELERRMLTDMIDTVLDGILPEQ